MAYRCTNDKIILYHLWTYELHWHLQQLYVAITDHRFAGKESGITGTSPLLYRRWCIRNRVAACYGRKYAYRIATFDLFHVHTEVVHQWNWWRYWCERLRRFAVSALWNCKKIFTIILRKQIIFYQNEIIFYLDLRISGKCVCYHHFRLRKTNEK